MGKSVQTTASAGSPASDISTAQADRPDTTGGSPTEIDLLRFELLRNANYHEARAGWFSGIHRLTLLLAIILGSGAVFALGRDFPELGQISGILVAVVTGLSLVYDYAGRARDHSELRRRYCELMARLDDDEIPKSVRADATRILPDEPATMYAVNALAHNAAGTTLWGDDFNRVKVGFMRRRLRHLVAFGSAEFPALPKTRT